MLFRTVGFTGTRQGSTKPQFDTLEKILRRVGPFWGVHGDCEGADTDFHHLLHQLREESNFSLFKIRIRPSTHRTRAWSQGYDEICEPKEPKERNLDIIQDADLVIGVSLEPREIQRSGTWHAIRRARRAGKPIVIIWPDGSVSWENLT